MFGLKKKPTTTEAQASSECVGNDLANPLASVRVEAGKYVFDAMPGQPDNDNGQVFDGEQRDKTKAAIERLYSDDRFHGTICGLFGWVGRKKGLKSLQIDKTDEDFKSACDVLYRRLMDGPIGPLLDRMSDKAIEDTIICMAGFGPVAVAVVSEVRSNRKVSLRKRNVTPQNDNKGEKNEQS